MHNTDLSNTKEEVLQHSLILESCAHLSSITFLTSKDEEKFDICKRIRFEVFVQEQGFKAEDEFDDHSIPVGTLRFTTQPKIKLSRIAILKSYRGKGLGSKFIKLMEDHFLKSDSNQFKISLHSQVRAIKFYEKLDFVAFGETFLVLQVLLKKNSNFMGYIDVKALRWHKQKMKYMLHSIHEDNSSQQ
ncbi:uncharacterized protein MELLADRAFT_108564 [Melampsora larici-populina 98AG31]|uniref:N-acetyltransferase domain-containing protein n=1 Tax=Melampsora larici-populina (strain 98AG31 / pathotype 3-4-7) TaxID=747676 RepID=F4RTH8_MELLP|nr:uncharacterized protein MELLADRAFT_108564 [Melampsora larici-populina 98AG31]EGG04257.1 hypothetical protein MELLADRAFT_108564 [Melampsora larici-populina 98AG31]